MGFLQVAEASATRAGEISGFHSICQRIVPRQSLWDETWQCWFPPCRQMVKVEGDIVGALRLAIRCAMSGREERGKGGSYATRSEHSGGSRLVTHAVRM